MSLGQLETREIRAGQGSKGTQVMRLCVQWRQLHDDRVLREPREVFPYVFNHKGETMKVETFFAYIAFVLTLIVSVAYSEDAPRTEPERGARVTGLVKLDLEPEQGAQVAGLVKLDPEIEKQLKCLAINIYKEAGYESERGQIAVAQVTLNRVDHREFPDTVCDVVYQKTRNRHSGQLTTCQFSWYCDPVHKNRPIHEPSYQKSYQIAQQVLLDGVRLKNLEDALFYHGVYINPRWRFERIETIGLHVFYRIPERREYTLAKL